MSRTIKFRAWDGNQVFPVTSLDFSGSGERLLSVVVRTGKKHKKNGYPCDLRLAKNVQLMQFTGLLDKNGKEIYEGDLLQLSGVGDDKQPYEVYYNDEGFGWKIRRVRPSFDCWGHEKGLCALSPRYLSVIGNIYETPELLNGKTVEYREDAPVPSSRVAC